MKFRLTEWGLLHIAEDVFLIATEIVTNAVEATPDRQIRVRFTRERDGVLLGVWDSSDELPVSKVLVELSADDIMPGTTTERVGGGCRSLRCWPRSAECGGPSRMESGRGLAWSRHRLSSGKIVEGAMGGDVRVRDVQGELVLRPDIGKGLLVLAAVAVGAAGMVAAILIGSAPSVLAWIVGGVFGVMFVVGAGYQVRSRIILNSHEIVVRGLVFTRRRSRSRAVKAVRATIVRPKGGQDDTLFVLDVHGSVLVRLHAANYAREDLDRLVNALGVPCSSPGRLVNANELGKEYPGIVPWIERHPYLLGLVILGLICVVALTAALIASGA